MAEATFNHGHPLMVDYTPGSAIARGQVIPVGDGCLIAHSDLASGVLAGVAAGGAVYTCPKATGVGEAIADRKKVYWDDTNNVITETASSNKFLGATVGASADDDETQKVQHCAPAA